MFDVVREVLEARLGDVAIAFTFESMDEPMVFDIRRARLRVPFVDGRPTTGTLAGRLWIEDLLATAPDLPEGESLLRTTLERQADLDPDRAGVCQSISIAFALELVPAELTP